MTRYYYKDPIAAFYMVREFGIIIENNAVLEEQVVKAGKWEKLSRTRYPVAKESEHIFELREGDDIIYNDKFYSIDTDVAERGILKDDAVITLDSANSLEGAYLVMRNNKQFLRPRKEND